MTDPDQPPPALPEASLHRQTRFQLIWLIPIVALLVAGYLVWDTIHARGPTVTLSFRTADGLQAGQTKVRHKAVELGSVTAITLSDDLSHVIVTVQMRREAIPELTERARFWVVRPRLSGGNVSGLDTLLSGAFIELDPGSPEDMVKGEPRRSFNGLDDPPAVRSDEPGTTYQLQAPRIGGITSGSPVLYRDVVVGEVLRWEFGPQGQGFFITIFVRRPFDGFVHQGTQFWNSSGVSLDLGADGATLRLGSLQALLSGAVAFDNDGEARATPTSPPGATFRMYRDQAAAAAAGYRRRRRLPPPPHLRHPLPRLGSRPGRRRAGGTLRNHHRHGDRGQIAVRPLRQRIPCRCVLRDPAGTHPRHLADRPAEPARGHPQPGPPRPAHDAAFGQLPHQPDGAEHGFRALRGS